MKKLIFIAFAAILAGLAISCQKEAPLSEKTTDVQYTFNITVNNQVGFDSEASTKGGSSPSYKTTWLNGDKIFLFFKPTGGSLLTNTYATLTYDESSWSGAVTGSTSLGNGGTLSAVYVYNLGDVTPEFSDDQWTIATGNTFYNCQTVSYTVSGNEISASLNLKAPANFVRFSVVYASGALTCDKVKGWKDVAIGSNLAVSNVTCTGYMDGYTNIGDSNVKEYYGRIVSGSSLENVGCKFSVVKNGKVYEYFATPKNAVRSFNINGWEEAEGKLPGLFTISNGADNEAGTADDVQVRFSKGNLYYDGSKFNFEANQYDFRTYAGKNSCINGSSSTTGTPTGHWGLFGWVGASSSFTGDAQYGVSTSTTASDYGNVASEALKSDWGNTIDNSGTWSTLSTAEWQYLFNNHVKVWGQFDSVNGYFIAPDGFVGDASTLSSLVSDWTAAEAAGIVFLPAAGYRLDSDVKNVGDYGIYWSSTALVIYYAYTVRFNSFDVYADDFNYRHSGYSVRLVTECQ